MKKIILLITLSLFISTANAQLRSKAYISYNADSISVIDARARVFEPHINIFSSKMARVSNNDDLSEIYVPGFKRFTAYNTYGDNIIKTQGLGNVKITELVASKGNKYYYFYDSLKVYRVDTSDYSVIDSFRLQEYKGVGVEMHIDVINDSIILYNYRGKLYKYHISSNQVVDSISNFVGLYKVYDGKIYYSREDTLKVADLSNMQNSTYYLASSQITITFSKPIMYNNKLYMPSYISGTPIEHYIEVFDINTNTFDTKIYIENSGRMFMSPDGEIWITNLNNKLSVLNLATKKIDEIALNTMPWYITFGKGNTSKVSIGAVNGLTTLKLYPNPAGNKITLETSYNEGKNYSIINSIGKTVMSIESEGKKTEVDISSLAPGIYFVLPNGDKTLPLKFIKQ